MDQITQEQTTVATKIMLMLATSVLDPEFYENGDEVAKAYFGMSARQLYEELRSFNEAFPLDEALELAINLYEFACNGKLSKGVEKCIS